MPGRLIRSDRSRLNQLSDFPVSLRSRENRHSPERSTEAALAMEVTRMDIRKDRQTVLKRMEMPSAVSSLNRTYQVSAGLARSQPAIGFCGISLSALTTTAALISAPSPVV